MTKRVIKSAVVAETGEIVKADQIFNTQKRAFDWRDQYSRDEVHFYCLNCETELGISINTINPRRKTFYFFHLDEDSDCVLKSKRSNEEIEEINRIYAYRESPRHKFLKRELSKRLKKTADVIKDSVKEEMWIVRDGKLDRRPDVFCLFEDKPIAFEIQLSILSRRYMLKRHDFYKAQGIYLIWLLEEFDPKSKSVFATDIQYLHKYENFFRLNEKKDDLNLFCTFKQAKLSKSDRLYVYTEWFTRSVAWKHLKFDQSVFQTFYYDTKQYLIKREKEKENIIEDRVKAAQEELKRKAERAELRQVKRIEKELKKAKNLLTGVFKNDGSFDHYYDCREYLDNLDYETLERLSYELKLDRVGGVDESFEGHVFLIHLLSKPNMRSKRNFLRLIFEGHRIRFDLKMTDNDGTTLLLALLKNGFDDFRYELSKELFKRQYQPIKEEIETIEELLTNEKDFTLERLYLLTLWFTKIDSSSVDCLHKKSMLFFGLETFKCGQLVAFSRLHNLFWVANYLMENYSEHGDVIRRAIIVYGLHTKLTKKESVRKNLMRIEAMDDFDLIDTSFKDILDILFPEVRMPLSGEFRAPF